MICPETVALRYTSKSGTNIRLSERGRENKFSIIKESGQNFTKFRGNLK